MRDSTKTKWFMSLSAGAIVLYILAVAAFWGVVVWGIINLIGWVTSK